MQRIKHSGTLVGELVLSILSGCQVFTPGLPCSATELVEFRKRIGTAGMEEIFKESVRVMIKTAIAIL